MLVDLPHAQCQAEVVCGINEKLADTRVLVSLNGTFFGTLLLVLRIFWFFCWYLHFRIGIFMLLPRHGIGIATTLPGWFWYQCCWDGFGIVRIFWFFLLVFALWYWYFHAAAMAWYWYCNHAARVALVTMRLGWLWYCGFGSELTVRDSGQWSRHWQKLLTVSPRNPDELRSWITISWSRCQFGARIAISVH